MAAGALERVVHRVEVQRRDLRQRQVPQVRNQMGLYPHPVVADRLRRQAQRVQPLLEVVREGQVGRRDVAARVDLRRLRPQVPARRRAGAKAALAAAAGNPVAGSLKVKKASYTALPSAFTRATTEPPPRSRRCRPFGATADRRGEGGACRPSSVGVSRTVGGRRRDRAPRSGGANEAVLDVLLCRFVLRGANVGLLMRRP